MAQDRNEHPFQDLDRRVVAVAVNDGDLDRVGPPIVRLFNDLMNAPADAP